LPTISSSTTFEVALSGEVFVSAGARVFVLVMATSVCGNQ